MNDSDRKDSIFLFGALVVLVLFALVAYGLITTGAQGQKTSDFTACMSRWASEVTNRTTVLAELNNARSEKTDRLLRDVAHDINGHHTPRQARRDQRRFKRDLRSYVHTSNRYKKVIKTHPPPEAPAAQC